MVDTVAAATQGRMPDFFSSQKANPYQKNFSRTRRTPFCHSVSRNPSKGIHQNVLVAEENVNGSSPRIRRMSTNAQACARRYPSLQSLRLCQKRIQRIAPVIAPASSDGEGCSPEMKS